MRKELKAKEIVTTQYKNTTISYVVFESGEIYMWEHDLDTQSDWWRRITLPSKVKAKKK
jgi:hypothetical protein